MNNMRRGFTMIELIFVIVIIGILAAVAIPKLAGTQKSAKTAQVDAFIGTLNRTILPTMYVKAIRKNGSVKGYDVEKYVDLPAEVPTIDFSQLAAGQWKKVATSKLGIDIYCRDGNATVQPKCAPQSDGNVTMEEKWYN